MFKGRAVDPGMGGVYPPPVDPFTPHRVDAAVLENEDCAVCVILEAARGRRIIEIPFAVDAVQFGRPDAVCVRSLGGRSEEHTSELQSLMRTSYAVFCLKKKTYKQ